MYIPNAKSILARLMQHTHTSPLRLFNTLTRNLEPFIPRNEIVSLYTCGPTVYHYAHIGNFRTYIAEDILKRTLLFLGHSVHHVMNITDVDDKTLRGANAQHISLHEFTAPYIQAFFEDIRALNIIPADQYPKATDYIKHMIRAIQILLDKGIAYQGQDRSIYFSIQHYANYGQLSHLNLSQLCTHPGHHTQDEYTKDHISDFALWKAYDPSRDGVIYWDSPFGPGRPGWHLECSVMSMEILGPSLDIHAGGVDNIFPHHENEIAQSESLSSQSFVRYWMHVEHLLVDNKKMSKSAGNFFTLRDLFEKGFTGTDVRFLFLQSHYRIQLNFTEASLLSAKQGLKRLEAFTHRLSHLQPLNQEASSQIVQNATQHFLDTFSDALKNDLNTPEALSTLFNYVRAINQFLDAEDTITCQELDLILNALAQADSVLSILPQASSEIPPHIHELASQRQQARANKQWQLADSLREKIASLGYEVSDTKDSFVIKKND